jgi:hypothetical protein
MNFRRIARTGTLLLSSSVVAVAVLAAPAHADDSPYTNDYLSALSGAGVAISDPATATAVGQSVCATLQQSGPDAMNVGNQVAQSLGVSPGMAGVVASIAVSNYCPSLATALAQANVADLAKQLPIGLPGF